MNREVANRDTREVVAFVSRPALASVERDPQSLFGSQVEQSGVYGILLDDVCVAAHRTIGRDKRLPRLAVILRPPEVRPHVAEHVQIERGVHRGGIEVSWLDGGYPGVFR